MNDLVVKAAATALREHPAVNVSYTEENLLFHKRIHVGVAVAVEDGLVVPVVRDADRKSVSEIGREARELAGKAREGKLSAQEMSGGTFSVSNLGMFGVDSFSAVINPPGRRSSPSAPSGTSRWSATARSCRASAWR